MSTNPSLGSLYARLEEVLGSPHADTLMTYLPNEPGAQVATRSDIAVLSERIDVLADRMERGFERLDARFEQVDTRLDQIDTRLDQIDTRLDQIDTRLDQVDVRFEQMTRQFERVDHRFEQMEDRFHLVRDDLRDQMKFFTVTTVGAMTALTAIYSGLLAVFA